MCISGKGIWPGKNALRARWSITDESLPMEYSSTGRSNWPAVSRRMWIASASNARRCDKPRHIVVVAQTGAGRTIWPAVALILIHLSDSVLATNRVPIDTGARSQNVTDRTEHLQ